MTTRLLTAAAWCVGGVTVAFAVGTIQQIKLVDGYDDDNRITTPVYQTAGLASVDIVPLTAGYDRKAKFVRRAGGNMWTKGPEYTLAQGVDIESLFTDALRSESAAMGFNRPAQGQATWRVGGSLKDIYLESKQVVMGATLFYGYMDVELELKGPAGESQTKRMRLHSYSGGYNAGLGRKDEAEAAAAHQLVEGAQETLARLNRDYFHAPPHPDVSARFERLRASGVDGHLADLHSISLSGLPAAVQPLLGMLPAEQEESVRSAIIDSLAQLGSPDAVAILAGRYAREGEDCRWYTLKAMDYIGGPEAERFVSAQGPTDKEMAPRRLAERIVAARGK